MHYRVKLVLINLVIIRNKDLLKFIASGPLHYIMKKRTPYIHP